MTRTPIVSDLDALHAVERMAGRRLKKWEVKMLLNLWDDIRSK